MTSERIKITAVGDISLNGIYRSPEFHEASLPWESLLPTFEQAALRLANLESMITTAERSSASKFALRAGENAVGILRASKFDILNMANNHAMDFGEAGLFDTMEVLDHIGVPYVGCGKNLDEALSPKILEVEETTFGFLSFCDVEQTSHLYAEKHKCGVAKLDAASLGHVRDLAIQVDKTIVQLHWGTEMCRLPTPQQRELARKFVEAGADLIIGHHPHVIQPMEFIDGVPVWYSLGNFTFSDEFWRGVKDDGEKFVGEYQVHELARITIAAHSELTQDGQFECKADHLKIGRDGYVQLNADTKADVEWRRCCDHLTSDNYLTHLQSEERLAVQRRESQDSANTIYRKFRLKAFQFGLMSRQYQEIH